MADKYPATLLAQTNDPDQIQKADLDLLKKINELSARIDTTATEWRAGVAALDETLSASVVRGSAIAAGATGVAKTIVSLSLTPGDWDVTAYAAANAAGGTIISDAQYGISKTDNALASVGFAVPTSGQLNLRQGYVIPAAAEVTLPALILPVTVTVATTIYLVLILFYTVSTATIYGSITARRRKSA